MGLPIDYSGEKCDQLRASSDTQKFGPAKRTTSEQIAAWGGLVGSESETNSTEREVAMPLPRDYDKPGRMPT